MRQCLAALLVVGIVVGHPSQAQSPAAESGTQFYSRYVEAVQRAERVEQLYPFWSAFLQAQVAPLSADQRIETFGLVRKIYALTTGVTVTGEAPTASGGVTLQLKGQKDGKPITGTARLVSEGGAWRLARQEQWAP